MNESKCLWKYMSYTVCIFKCVIFKKRIKTLWTEWAKRHIENSEYCFNYWKVLTEPNHQKKGHGGRKRQQKVKKTTTEHSVLNIGKIEKSFRWLRLGLKGYSLVNFLNKGRNMEKEVKWIPLCTCGLWLTANLRLIYVITLTSSERVFV